jgi:L-iditol 2-dehydrogenase
MAGQPINVMPEHVMNVARIEEDYGIGVAQMPLPELPPGGALVKVLGCGVCGSDLDKFVNKKAKPGSILGHEMVGIIEALGEGHLGEGHPDGWHVGDRIVSSHHAPCGTCHYCLNDSESMCRQFKRTNFNPGGFCQYIALSEEHLRHTAFPIPAGVTLEEASCMEPLSCVLRAIRRGGTQVNGSVLIVGLGFIGMMAAQVYQNDGYSVYGVDLDASRNTLAKDQDFLTDAFHPIEEGERLRDTLHRQLALGKVDTVFLTAVNAKTIELALENVRDGGNIIVFTSAPAGTAIDPTQLYFREINLITSYSPALCDLRDAARMIFQHKIEVEPLISHRLPLDEISQAFELYRSGQAIKVFIQMGEV